MKGRRHRTGEAPRTQAHYCTISIVAVSLTDLWGTYSRLSVTRADLVLVLVPLASCGRLYNCSCSTGFGLRNDQLAQAEVVQRRGHRIWTGWLRHGHWNRGGGDDDSLQIIRAPRRRAAIFTVSYLLNLSFHKHFHAFLPKEWVNGGSKVCETASMNHFTSAQNLRLSYLYRY